MIQAIKELGELTLKREGRDTSDPLSILVENPNQDERCPKSLVAVFKKETTGFKYSEIKIEDVSKAKIKKYLYCRRASQGPDYTPTAKITEVKKFFKNKVKSWFKKYGDIDNSIIKKLKAAIEEQESVIVKDLSQKFEETKQTLKRVQMCLFTLAIEEESELKYIGEFSIFKELLVNSVKQDYQKIPKKTNHVCAVCGMKKPEVYGEAIPIPFYTLDKPGYIAGGFHKEGAWKNAPVCLECSLKISEGKKFLDTKLKQRMGKQQYYLIPKFIIGVEGIEEIIDTFFSYFTKQEEVLKSRELKRITEDEGEILEVLGELKDVLTYNFLFFSTPNPQVFEINLLVEDILPSRISTIFAAKKKAEEPEIFKDVKVKEQRYENIEFRFDVLRQFTPSQKAFLGIIDKTFRGIEIDSELLFSWFMRPIREHFLKDMYLKPIVLKSFVTLLFFKKLGLLYPKENLKKGGELMTELKEKAERFFADFSETFQTPAHKVVFLLGALTQTLLNIQYQQRSATPFRKNLKGLRMKEEDFKALLPKIQNKLEEYNKNYYVSLETLISEYFLEAGKDWGISTDELNFYFVLGMNLMDKVFKSLELKKEKEENNV